MSTNKETFKSEMSGEYIIALSKWRSILALAASLITVAFSIYAIAGGIVFYVEIGRKPAELFQWFTINANFLTAFSACMIIPFAVEGIRKKFFSYPKWVAVFHYSGMLCTTITMVFSVLIMSWIDPHAAFGGYNLYLHIFCPIMVIISFFLVEAGFQFTLKDALIAAVPALLYVAIYTFEVVIVGEENGGWEDMYHVKDFLPVTISVPLIVLLILGTSLLIRWIYTRLTILRNRRMIANLWPRGVDPIEINIEMFGLGRYMGKHADPKFIILRLELINMIAELYGLKTEDLIRPFVKGFKDSIREKNENKDNKKKRAG